MLTELCVYPVCVRVCLTCVCVCVFFMCVCLCVMCVCVCVCVYMCVCVCVWVYYCIPIISASASILACTYILIGQPKSLSSDMSSDWLMCSLLQSLLVGIGCQNSTHTHTHH